MFKQNRYRERRYPLAWWIIGTFTFAIEALLGINAAFIVDQSSRIVTDNMLAGTQLAVIAPFIALIVGIGFGFCLMVGGLWTFGGFHDSLTDAKAYAEDNAEGGIFNVPFSQLLLWALALGIMGLDYFTLSFRMIYFQQHEATSLFYFFCILIPMPMLLGYLMYVLSNVPRQRVQARVQAVANRLTTADMTHAIETMDADLRERVANGDMSAINEHYERVQAANEAIAHEQGEKLRIKAEKKSRKYAPYKAEEDFQQAGPNHRN